MSAILPSAMPVMTETPMTVVSSNMGVWQRLKRIWEYRELLVGMVRKELKVKYKDSALGFVWSMLNPALYLVVFYVVFVLVLKNGIPVFPIFLLSGLLVWNLFSAALPAATGSVVGNSSIIKKVAFPREILPIASVGAAMVHFFLQSIVLIGAMVLVQYDAKLAWMWLLIPALIALLIFTAAISVFLSAVNVYMRDTQHLLELVLLAWFWGTAVVYPFRLISAGLKSRTWIYLFVNPIAPIVLTFQRVLYNKLEPIGRGGIVVKILPVREGQWWYFRHDMVIIGISIVLFLGALSVFGRLEGNFAEEL